MADFSRFRFLNPVRIVRGVNRRIREGGGVGAAALHGVRKAGTVMDRALVGPMLIRINPMGYVCNHTCPMCWLQHLDPEELKAQKKVDRDEGLKLADYERLFDGMPVGLEMVELVGGGEPLVHPDSPAIMAAIKRRGWMGSLISNGALLKEPLAQKLVEMQWDIVRISVHAGDAETYKLIQGVDHYETVLQNLKTYTRLRTRGDGTRQGELAVFHVIQRENIDRIESLFEFGAAVGADAMVFEKVIAHDGSMVLTPDEVHRAREAIWACAQSSKIPVNIDAVIPDLMHEAATLESKKKWVPGKRCSVGFDQAFITALGDVLPCCFSNEVMGNVRHEKFSDVWAGEKYDAFRKRLNHGKFSKYCISNHCSMKSVVHQ